MSVAAIEGSNPKQASLIQDLPRLRKFCEFPVIATVPKEEGFGL